MEKIRWSVKDSYDRNMQALKEQHDLRLQELKNQHDQTMQVIKQEHDKVLRQLGEQKEIRFKAELVAELLAEWINNNEDRQKLNELSYKAFLWLPAEVAEQLSNELAHAENRQGIRKILIETRKHLLGASDPLTEDKVISFPVSKTDMK